MTTNGALIEYLSYYEICADGKPVAWFKTMGDSLLPEEMSLKADSTVMNKRLIEGVFVNGYAFLPSCKGRILATFPDSLSLNRLAVANKSVASLLRKATSRTAEEIKRMGEEAEETDYFLRTHNVSDDGYNTIAEFSAQLNERKRKAEALLSTLKGATAKSQLSVRMIRRYTLLCRDTAATVKRIACNELTEASQKPFVMLQTADKRTPNGATAVYIHHWFTPKMGAADSVIVASHPSESVKTIVFRGAMADEAKVKMPPTLTPNGAAAYTERGFFIGVCHEGRVIKPCNLNLK